MGVKRRNETKNLLVIKFFGMGSIVRMAYVLKNSDVDLTNITLITLKKNEQIVELLEIPVIYIRSNSILVLWDITRAILNTWFKTNTRVIDLERSSNIAGIFRVLCSIQKPSSSFYFDNDNHVSGKHLSISLKDKSAVEVLYEALEVKPIRNKEKTKGGVKNSVIVNVNAGEYLPERKYPITKFAEIVQILYNQNQDLKFVLTGGINELEYVSRLERLLKKWSIPVKNQTGKQSMQDLAGEIQNGELLITNDSGPLHLANYYATPCIVLWGPTSAKSVGYSDSEIMKNISTHEHCSPCFVNPKSSIAKECQGEITCFVNLSPKMIAAQIGVFKSNIDKVAVYV